jgi:hypothetical protein
MTKFKTIEELSMMNGLYITDHPFDPHHMCPSCSKRRVDLGIQIIVKPSSVTKK